MFGFVNVAEHKDTTGLSHCLYLKYAWHYGFAREVSLEERLVECNILDTHNFGFGHLYNLIHQQERIAVRHNFLDTVDIDDGGFGDIKFYLLPLLFRFLDFLTDKPKARPTCRLLEFQSPRSVQNKCCFQFHTTTHTPR